ncbi:MAG: hypothetical protein ACLUFV_01595 [Acutalibacteraceae bacterium]
MLKLDAKQAISVLKLGFITTKFDDRAAEGQSDPHQRFYHGLNFGA